MKNVKNLFALVAFTAMLTACESNYSETDLTNDIDFDRFLEGDVENFAIDSIEKGELIAGDEDDGDDRPIFRFTQEDASNADD